MNEGYIRYNCNWEKTKVVVPQSDFEKLEIWRNKLYKKGLIGLYKNGIGFGNVSCRIDESLKFYITGSVTGKFEFLKPEHIALVNSFSLKDNSINCIGPTKASSESLSHAIIYETLPEINSVIHIHHLGIWEKHINKLPTTAEYAEYGTPEMAIEIRKLLKDTNNAEQKTIVMAGHKEGIIAFGKTLKEVGELLIKLLESL